jgi:hypothetical protein
MMLIRWVEAYILWRKETEALLAISKETGLEVNAEKRKYSIWSCLETRMQDKITT